MIASLLLLSITIQYVQGQKSRKGYGVVVDELKQVRMEMAGQVTSVTELRASVLHQVGYQLRQPLDSIIALSLILSNEYADPRINAVSKVLSAEAGVLKRKIEKEVGNPGLLEVSLEQDGDVQDLKQIFEDVPAPRPWINSRICLYDTDPGHAARTALILRSKGYDVVIMSDQYRILSSISTGKVDVLIVDPTSAGEGAFALSGLIRGDYNLFEIPILMITNYYDDYLMKKGYAAGVNDFLTRPFDASELAARVQSLIKLKQVARHNHDLARSEKEKNTFLYFLTHNINTPLTLLLNRVNELEDFEGSQELDEITDDLIATSREIRDIVQNVLISFRLSDGRQTVRLNEIEIEPIISAVSRALQKKADEKNQKLIYNFPDSIPIVMGDFAAVRGVVYNLIDNGLKFSPAGAKIRISVSISDTVNLEISDTGPGISPGDQDRLFERFERLSPQPTAGESSTGLGLYVAHELALMNGGSLEYISGRAGACFLFRMQKFYKETVDV
jgi:DNA-binding response OmpR family regulator